MRFFLDFLLLEIATLAGAKGLLQSAGLWEVLRGPVVVRVSLPRRGVIKAVKDSAMTRSAAVVHDNRRILHRSEV